MPLGTISAGSGAGALRVSTASTWPNARNHGDGNLSAVTTFFEASSGFECGRQYYFFDLSAIPDNIVINSGTMVIPAVTNLVATLAGSTFLCSHTATTPLTSSDTQYNSIGSEKTWGSLAFASYSNSVANPIALTAAGIAALVPATVNKIALRHGHDTDNTSPGTSTDQFTIDATTVTLVLNYTVNARNSRNLMKVGI